MTLQEKIVRYLATHMRHESALLYPHFQPIVCDDPYGILKLIEEDGTTPEQIDAWLVDEQERTK